MLFLILTILLNVIIFIQFKIFHKYGIDQLQAIVVNYLTCVLVGCFMLGGVPAIASAAVQPWFYWALVMGGLFIGLFNLMAWRTAKDGMTTTTIANKLSLVIPVVFAVWLYNEELTALKIVGIVLALPAVYFTAHIRGEDEKSRSVLWPAILFVGSGSLDTLVKYVEQSYLSTNEAQTSYLIYVFFWAFFAGALMIAVRLMQGRLVLSRRSLLAGIALGIPNYFSIYCLIKLLHSNFLHSSAAIPVNNIGIVLLSTIAAIIFFREKETPQRIFGLVLSIVSIILIALADVNG